MDVDGDYYSPMQSVEVRQLERLPDARSVFAHAVPGAMLFEGWSSGAAARILLPWPDEIRELAWSKASSWKAFLDDIERDTPDATVPSLPFAGGWGGFLAYETTALDEGAVLREPMTPEPAAFFARHSSGVVIDNHGRAYVFAPPATIEERIASLLDCPSEVPPERSASEVTDSLAGGLHAEMVAKIRGGIRDGAVYQVNLTREYKAHGAFDAVDLYETLTAPDPPRSSALIHGRGWTIVSASPEVLLDFDRASGVASSLPIKGTVSRHGDDAREIAELLASAKDESEHLMIVDVVRNDFGKIAPAGHVSVSHYRTVRTLRHVHHLESTVSASGLSTQSLSTILAALSPAASITGTPKRAAVQMIRHIEPVPRGVYCGSIGLFDRHRVLFSVAIRTAVVTPESVRYHAGGGIVWDSDALAEEAECRAKAAAFMRYVGGEER